MADLGNKWTLACVNGELQQAAAAQAAESSTYWLGWIRGDGRDDGPEVPEGGFVCSSYRWLMQVIVMTATCINRNAEKPLVPCLL